MIPKSGVRFSDKIMRRKGRRSAERRMPTIAAQHQQTSPPADDVRARPRRHADKCTQVYALIRFSGRARLPVLPPRLSQGLPPLLSFRPCFLGRGSVRDPQRSRTAKKKPAGVTRPLQSQSSDSTSRLGRSTEGLDTRSRSGADCETARKHRTSPHSSDRNASLWMDEMRCT